MRAALATLLIFVLSSSALAIGSGFIENRGQVEERVLYYTLGSRMAVYFTKDAVVFDLKESIPADDPRPVDLFPDPTKGPEPEEPAPRKGCAVYIRFEGANPAPVIEARGRLETEYNYFLGDDPANWRTEVPAFQEVRYRDLWPGVDLVYRQDGGRLTYEVIALGEGDLERARFAYEGADRVFADREGCSRIETPVGSITDIRSGTGSRAGAYLLEEGGDESGGKPARSGEKENPSALIWGTFLGGSGGEQGYALALDSSGDPVLTGSTWSIHFPTTPGAYDTSYNGTYDAFVAKLSSTGSSLLWSTFLGGSNRDEGSALALDSSGNPVVSGDTYSADFPTTPGAYDTSNTGGYDGFVAKLSSAGSTLLWSTFLGGSSWESNCILTLDISGNPVLAGATLSSNFPTTPGAYDTSHNGTNDTFVAKLSSTGSSLLWSTFLGGSGDDRGSALALDSSGNPIVTGWTRSSNFPATPGAYDTSLSGVVWDAFVAKLSTTGASLLWSTYLGGDDDDYASSLTLDPSGSPVVVGYTESADFPTLPGGYDTTYNGGRDVFVTKLSDAGNSLLWSTFLGGSSSEYGGDIVLDSSGAPVLTGSTSSSDFPTTPCAYDTSCSSSDVFVSKLSNTGGSLIWSSFLGGSYGYSECGNALVLDSVGNAVLTGVTWSNFPTTPGAYDTSPNGDYDVFVAKVSVENPTGVEVARPVTTVTMSGGEPNPARDAVSIQYVLARDARVALRIYDIRGRVVSEQVVGLQPAGGYRVIWDGRDTNGETAAPGVYFARLHAGEYGAVRKMVLLR